MAQYQIINQKVEIGGKTREIGAIIDETEFRPAEGESPSEIASLLETQHIIEVTN